MFSGGVRTWMALKTGYRDFSCLDIIAIAHKIQNKNQIILCRDKLYTCNGRVPVLGRVDWSRIGQNFVQMKIS